MKIISPSIEIMNLLDGKTVLEHLERCGRVCYKSEDKIEFGSAEKFLANIIKRGHEAVLEHYSFTVKFTCDRGVSHEIVRHRMASYCQESTRYVASSKKTGPIENEADVLTAYCEAGMSMKKIADKSDGKYTEWDISEILRQHEVPKRNIGRRGLFNEDFFEVIDTPEKAYLLGFIMADGSVRRDLSQLTITQKEDESWWLLNMIRDFVQPDAKSLTLHSHKLCTDLFEKGIIPNKTYEFTAEHADKLWNCIPEKHKMDFIRGVLDGDGSIRWFYQTPASKTLSCHIQFAGNGALMQKIGGYINERFNYTGAVKKDSKSQVLYRYVLSGHDTGMAFCKELYANFKFPYGHSKTARYFEAINQAIPCMLQTAFVGEYNVILPQYPNDRALWDWGRSMFGAEMTYKALIDVGRSPQEARAVLPTSLKTEVVMTANIREWRHFLKLRTSAAAHPQIRELAIKLLKELQERVPVLFDDIAREG